MKIHERDSFGFFQIIADLGGVHEFFLVTISMMLGPISHYSFINKAAKKLFYARTYSRDLFTDRGSDCETKKFV